jgi:hypothetical protein
MWLCGIIQAVSPSKRTYYLIMIFLDSVVKGDDTASLWSCGVFMVGILSLDKLLIEFCDDLS